MNWLSPAWMTGPLPSRRRCARGHLEMFLGAVGRLDLAAVARETARLPDPDRGLDQLLGQLPGDALTPAKLVVKTPVFDLGPLAIGAQRRFVLTLANSGTRLLYGSIVFVETPWLVFGQSPESTQKVFQFGAIADKIWADAATLALLSDKVFQFMDRADVPIEVAGIRLRAGLKPLEGQIVIESNGGTASVPVRAAVPPIPFPEGVLKGALTPRQVAEKAKAAPKEASAFFENRAVANWYRSNGWYYPVRGPSASGLGAVQQFFEALCLTRPPKVTLSVLALELKGRPGQMIAYTLRVQTEENRPVYRRRRQ